MKKLLLSILLVLTILLSACNAASKTAEPTAVPTAALTRAASEAASPTVTPDTVLNADKPCMPYSFIDRVLSTPYPGLPPVTDEDYTVGSKDAPVTYIVYSEPQCPYCALFDTVAKDFQAMYPTEVRIVYRFRPFSPEMHDKSVLLSQAMVAAGFQGKFNEFKDWIFLHQNKDLGIPAAANFAETDFWVNLAPTDLNAWLTERVSELGIVPDQLLKDMASDKAVNAIQAAAESADTLGINSTPSIFINGHKFKGNWLENNGILSLFTELVLSKSNELFSCPETVIDTSKTYTATLSTTKGDILINLFDDTAMHTVNSFVYLAGKEWYNDIPILSTTKALITGDPRGTGYAGPGYAYLDEINPELNFNDPGFVATWYSEPNRNGSVFFINKTALPDESGRTIFGKVTSGMDVVNSLANGDKLISVTITEK